MAIARAFQIVYVATPLACWCINALLGRRRIHWVLLFVVTCIVDYVLLIAAVQVIEHALDAELYRHDLNGDGMFSEDEMTKEAERAMNAVTNDTARTFAPFTGIPITFIWTCLNFVGLAIAESVGRYVCSRIFGKPPDAVVGTADVQIVAPQADSQNPYRPPSFGQ